MFVKNKTVHVPQAGTIPAVQKNRTVLLATIGQRTDTDRTYDLGEYTTDPILIGNTEEIQVVYEKRQSVLKQHIEKIDNRLGKETANAWAGAGLVTASGQIVETTGTATAGIMPTGATGNRNAVAIEDIANCAKKLDKDEMPMEGRYMLMPSDMYWSMLNDNAELLNSQYMNKGNLPDGVVNRIHGINIMLRSFVTLYTNATVPVLKAVNAAVVATDNHGAICWHESRVAKALGAVTVFGDEAKPEYYGDIFSALVLFAADALRDDGTGVVTLVQNV